MLRAIRWPTRQPSAPPKIDFGGGFLVLPKMSLTDISNVSSATARRTYKFRRVARCNRPLRSRCQSWPRSPVLPKIWPRLFLMCRRSQISRGTASGIGAHTPPACRPTNTGHAPDSCRQEATNLFVLPDHAQSAPVGDVDLVGFQTIFTSSIGMMARHRAVFYSDPHEPKSRGVSARRRRCSSSIGLT